MPKVPLATSQPFSAPELEGYTFVRVLGSGGFAQVCLYEQDFPRRMVAVKVMSTVGQSDVTERSFMHEANVMARLSAHPNIVTIYGAGIARDGRRFVVMEYCPGGSLADRVRTSRSSAADTLRTGVRLASAIAAAHAEGVLHGDVKPANVLVNNYGTPALTDFGISSAIELPIAMPQNRVDNSAESASTSVGYSVPWAPPEVLGDDPHPDVRSDVFSLAASLWTLATGRSPFVSPDAQKNSTIEIMDRILAGAISDPEAGQLPETLKSVLLRALSFDPSGRYLNASEFGRALQRVELELNYTVTPLEVDSHGDTVPPVERAESDLDSTVLRAASSGARASESEEETVLRDPSESSSQAEGSAPPATPDVPSSPNRRVPRSLVVGAIAVAALGAVMGAVVTGAFTNGTTAAPEAEVPQTTPPVEQEPEPAAPATALDSQSSAWDRASTTASAGAFAWRFSESPSFGVSLSGLTSTNGGGVGFATGQFATLYEEPNGTFYSDASCSGLSDDRDDGTGDLRLSCSPYTDFGGALVTSHVTVFGEGDLLRWVFDIENPTPSPLSPGWYFTAEFPEQDSWLTSSGGASSRPFYTREDRWVVNLPAAASNAQLTGEAISAGVVWAGPDNTDSPCIEPGGSFAFDGAEYIGISVNCFPSESVILPRPNANSLAPGETWRVVIYQLLEPNRWASPDEARASVAERMTEFDSLSGRLVRGMPDGPEPINW